MSNILKLAGILSSPKSTLTPELFNGANKMHDHVRLEILKRITDKIPADKIKGVYIIGSITGYKYSPESDVDVDVNVSTDYFSDDIRGLRITKDINGKPVKGGTHPVAYFISE